MHVSVHTPDGQKRVWGPLELEVLGICELPDGGLEANPGPLQKQYALPSSLLPTVASNPRSLDFIICKVDVVTLNFLSSIIHF